MVQGKHVTRQKASSFRCATARLLWRFPTRSEAGVLRVAPHQWSFDPIPCSLKPSTSYDRVPVFLEDAEGARAHGHEVLVAVADLGLDGGDATGAVHNLCGAGDPAPSHSP